MSIIHKAKSAWFAQYGNECGEKGEGSPFEADVNCPGCRKTFDTPHRGDFRGKE